MERPLNISPDAWEKLKNTQIRRGSAVQMDRSAAPKKEEEVDENTSPLVLIDMSIDGLLANVKRLTQAIDAAKKSRDLNREETMSLDAIQDLVNTALAPYLADIIKEMDVFEGVEN